MSPLCQGRICHTRRCTLSHDRPQDISSTALDNFFLILSLLFSASPPFLACFFPPFCFYFYTPLISVPGMKGSSGRLSVYLSVHLHLSTYLSRYALYSFFFILTSTSFIFCSTFLVVVCYHPLASHSRFAPILVSVSIFLSISPRYPSSLLFYSLSLSLSFSLVNFPLYGILLKNLRRDKSLFAGKEKRERIRPLKNDSKRHLPPDTQLPCSSILPYHRPTIGKRIRSKNLLRDEFIESFIQRIISLFFIRDCTRFASSRFHSYLYEMDNIAVGFDG